MVDVKVETLEFYNFLIKHNIIGVGMAFIIGSQINMLATAFVNNIVSPTIGIFMESNKRKLEDIKIPVLGAKIEIGSFIESILKFVLTMIIIFYFFRVIDIKK
jgi:large conductance mechanosensitive channel